MRLFNFSFLAFVEDNKNKALSKKFFFNTK